MRRFLPLVTVLLIAVVAAGAPLATPSSPAAAPVLATPHVAAATGGQSSPALICILPRCNGPYCRASNGCWVCCP